MDRKIKFRGRVDNLSDFVYGTLLVTSLRWGSKTQIVTLAEDEESEDIFTHVHPAYTGQFTGLKDKNGVDIYEDDLVLQFGFKHPAPVEFFNSAWRLHRLYILGTEIKTAAIEVVGNIYQNPELLTK